MTWHTVVVGGGDREDDPTGRVEAAGSCAGVGPPDGAGRQHGAETDTAENTTGREGHLGGTQSHRQSEITWLC